MLADHVYFKYPIYFYCLFAFAQLASGSVLYFVKIGLHPPAVLEYYRGSLAMRETYPDEPDRFIEPKTARGLLKVSLPHFLFYAFNGFFFVHLIRSLLKGRRTISFWFSPRGVNLITVLYFLGAALDIGAGYLVRYGPHFFVYVRILAFFWFTLAGFALVSALAFLLLTTRDDSRHPG